MSLTKLEKRISRSILLELSEASNVDPVTIYRLAKTLRKCQN